MTSRERLRVGIDGRAFTSPAGGVRRYVNGLVEGFKALGEPIELVALGGAPDARPAGVGWTKEPPHPPTNAGWMLVGLPWAAARAGVALIHAPAYTAPFVAGVPIVLTIHDVSYERHPEWFPYRRDRIRRVFYRRSARGATHILTDSAFSAAEIQAAYGIPRHRMTVAPLGVDPSFTPVSPGAACELPAGVRAPFLLHVGDLHERRNVVTVIAALAAARRHLGVAAGLSLVLAGIDRGVAEGLRQLAARLGLADAVVLLGATSEARLRDLYRGASALVYPSLYEGFGFPLLEAMASGLPVIASQAASMPEVVGDAGTLVAPLDAAAWADAIVRVVNDDDRRAAMREAGLRRASSFTWARTAGATLRVYQDALGGAH